MQEAYGSDQDAHAKGTSDQLNHLEQLLGDVPQAWLNRSDIRVAIAEAYGELREFSKAIEHYSFALDTGELDSKTTIKAAEQLFNFTARQAERDKDPKRLRDAIARLKAMQDIGETSERFNLLGSAYKGLATVLEQPAAVRKAIVEAARFYGESARRHAERDSFDHYPVVNRLGLLAVLGSLPSDWEELLSESALNAKERFLRDRGTKDAVFHAVASVDIAVVRALAGKTLAVDNAKRTDAIKEIVGEYRQTLSAVQASPRQMDSVVRQLETLAALMDKLSPKLAGGARLRRDGLEEIAKGLRRA